MENAINQLAFALNSQKGCYALFLGAGISIASGIPSTWSIVTDLCRKIAIQEGFTCVKDPVKWYIERYKNDPEYSEILNRFATSSTIRQSMMKGYFEQSEEDVESGLKNPTLAHKAIAKLVKEGYVRMILTLNFDRLIEHALDAENVSYQVIKDASEIESAIPYIHSNCTIVKINGDYLDCRFKNTIDELSNYDPILEKYLARIFEDFGLITCGWAARWDIRLIEILKENVKTRYPSVCTYIDDNNKNIIDLSKEIGGFDLKIKDADSFFQELYDKTNVMEQLLKMPKSLTIKMALVKKYLPVPENIIKLNDLLLVEVDRALQLTTKVKLDYEYPSHYELEKVIKEYATSLSDIIPMMIECVHWAENRHYDIILDVLNRFLNREFEYSDFPQSDLSKRWPYIPGAMILFAVGTACVCWKKYDLLDLILSMSYYTRNNHAHFIPGPIVCVYNEWIVNPQLGQLTAATPLNYYLFVSMSDHFKFDAKYYSNFRIFEKFLSLYYSWKHIPLRENFYNCPRGMFYYDVEDIYQKGTIENEHFVFFREIDEMGNNHPIFNRSDKHKRGMFMKDYSIYQESLKKMEEFFEKNPRFN